MNYFWIQRQQNSLLFKNTDYLFKISDGIWKDSLEFNSQYRNGYKAFMRIENV